MVDSGGTKITTATALTTLLATSLGWDIADSVDTPRLHHQLRWRSMSTKYFIMMIDNSTFHPDFSPMLVEHESSLPASIVQGLRLRGHETEDTGGAGSVVQVNTGL